MNSFYTSVSAKAKQVIALIAIVFFVTLSEQAVSQCSTCTSGTYNTSNATINVNSGGFYCLTYSGTYTGTINMNGGTLCISAATHVTSTVNNFNSGTINNFGNFTGGVSMGGGTFINQSGGTFHPSSITINSGFITNNSGGNMTLPSITVNNGVIITNNGTATLSGFTINSGGTVALNGTQTTISGSVTNNGTFTLAGPSTITGSFTQNSGAVSNFSGGITISGSATNNSTINLAGNLTIGGSYSDNSGATIKETQAGCSTVAISGSNPGNGTFNGNGNGLIVNSSPSNSGSLQNGASTTLTAPTQAPTGPLALSVSALTVTGSFTSPSAAIAGYIVLRYIGTTAPTDNPTNYATYSVGSTIGSSTVVALISSSATGTRTFTDNVGATACGQTVYYRVFSYNGGGQCRSFYMTPLTGNIAMPNPTATITPTGSTTVCSPATATLTAGGGGTYVWSNSLGTAATVYPSATGTYAVTVTGTDGCTATASKGVTINPAPTVTTTNGGICPGGTATLTATGGGTYAWSGGLGSAATVYPTVAGSYTVTVTTSGCSTTATATAATYAAPTVTAGSNSPVATGSAINLTSTASGTSPYTYSWSGPSGYVAYTQNPTITSASGSTAGTYTITVTDANCSATASTIVTEIAPGGTASGMSLWLKANTGVTNLLGVITSWNDQSGAGNNASTVNGIPPTLTTNSLNSYPVVTLPGTGGFQGTFGTSITSSTVTAFTVMQPQTGGNYAGVLSMAKTGVNDYDNVNSACLFFNDNGGNIGSYTNNNYCGVSGGAVGGPTSLFTTSFSASNDSFFTSGKFNYVGSYSPGPFNSQKFTVGDRYPSASGTQYITGKMAEVILYNRQLSSVERNKVESYLALKYGISLNQVPITNYVSSGGILMWSAASNGIYNNNIFGVGIDNGSSLSQSQSVSINTAILSLSNATALTNNSFFVVSDNGATGMTTYSGMPSFLNTAMSHVWRASQTGTRTSTTYSFNSSLYNLGYYAPIAASMTPYMIIDSNGDGIVDSYIAATSITGTTSTYSANLRDGALFTFGFKASIDYGDAPNVPTTVANNGAGHMIVSGVYLGSLIDAELDGQPSVNSLGDDTIGLADEDGVNFNIGVPTNGLNILQIGQSNSIQVTASTAGYLNAWIDLDQSGSYDAGSEWAIINVHLAAGLNTVSFNLSDSIAYGATSMRFRFAQNSGDVTAPTGLATNGEVEDYQVYITAPLVGPCTNGFQNPSFEMGPSLDSNSIIITSQNNLPYWRTTATDKQVEVWGSGFNSVPAYNGTYFVELEANLYGALYQDVYTTPGTTVLWSFAHRGRLGSDTCNLKIGSPANPIVQTTVIDGSTAWGVHQGSYVVPANQYITRFAFNAIGSYGGNQSVGNFIDDMSVSTSFDYGDAPDTYKTLRASNGPYHVMTGTLYLGANVSCDADGQPSAAATLDTYDDGVTFPTPCSNCNTYTVNISAFNNSGSKATIAGWIDFNKNGIFDNAERASIVIPSSASQQTTSMTFTLTSSMYSTSNAASYARFRIANDSTQVALPYGLASSGEVEDYKVTCVALSIPVPTTSGTTCRGATLSLNSSLVGVYQTWTGPASFTAVGQNVTRTNMQFIDSGIYRVYALYANGCETDSATTKVAVQSCYVNVTGTIFDDANGNGVIDGLDSGTTRSHTIYAVLADTNGIVQATALAAANGTFSMSTAPAYLTGMTLIADTVNASVGSTLTASLWPSRWVGTAGNYGSNNLAGSGTVAKPYIPVSTSNGNVTSVLMGYDRLPTTTARLYTIPYPLHNSQKKLVRANYMGLLAGSDPEDGAIGAGKKFIVTDISTMHGNSLYYDGNGDGVLQSYEQITGYTVITSFDSTRLMVKFTGGGSTSAIFSYGSADAAGQVDPTPSTYTINWTGTLPVKLLSFTAEKYSDQQSMLKWATASEINNDHFNVERSADAETWDSIGSVKGAGNSNQDINYSYIDQSPLSGMNYYRLKQVDIDGNFEYTDIADVQFSSIVSGSGGIMTSYPNPVTSGKALNIVLSGSEDVIKTILITDQLGQTVYTDDVLSSQVQNYQVRGLDLPTGLYTIYVISQANGKYTSKVVIQK